MWQGFHTPLSYVLTQLPLTETVDDFWRLVVTEQCHSIVLLDRVGSDDVSQAIQQQVIYKPASPQRTNRLIVFARCHRSARPCNTQFLNWARQSDSQTASQKVIFNIIIHIYVIWEGLLHSFNRWSSEESQLWVVIGGSEKNRLRCVATGMSGKQCDHTCCSEWPASALIHASSLFRHWSVA